MNLVIFTNLSFLILLIFLGRFGIAEKFGNLFLFLAIFLVGLQFSKVKIEPVVPPKNQSQKKLLYWGWVSLVLVVLLTFKAIFSNGPAVWGDAPYFYPESFRIFFAEPLVWESRGKLGVVNDLYFLYPIMLVYRYLGAFWGLGNDVIIRLLFYFPALFFAFLGPFKFSRYLGFSALVSFFASLIYLINTYFILILDGGQIGVVLAYGLFPIALLNLLRLKKYQTLSQFFISLASFLMIIAADVRFAVIAVLATIFWLGFERSSPSKKFSIKHLKIPALFTISTLAIGSYWILPLFVLEPTTGSGVRSELLLINILHPLLLFSPHWPFNEFGKISPPYWFFGGVPILVFLNLFFKKKWYTLALIINFLLFVFLAKGDTGFLGGAYAWLVDNVPMGGAFRDSTKFFAPLLLYTGILIGLSVENLSRLFKKTPISFLITALIFGYLVFLASPAITGNMNGVLAKREFPQDIKITTELISNEKNFLRTVWFPERHPLSYQTEDMPALDARVLVDLRPFASINTGISDRFNFLHNKQYLEWLDILGVKYMIFSGDTHKVLPDREKEDDWSRLLNLAKEDEGLSQVSLGTSFSVYQTKHQKPRIFTVDKIFAVLGGDDIYQKLFDLNEKFSIGDQGFVFLDDGKFNPRSLGSIASESAVLLLNDKEKLDLALSLLSDFFVSPSSNLNSQWAVRSTEEYLKWKFEFLVNNLKSSEFDYGKGIAFSSIPNEKLNFNLDVKEEADYILAVRHMAATGSNNLQLSINNHEEEIPSNTSGTFSWFIKEVRLHSGIQSLVIKNTGGFQVVNVVALIPRQKWEEAGKFSEAIINKFPVVNTNTNHWFDDPVLFSEWQGVDYQMENPSEYNISAPKGSNWLVFTDSYHPSWILKSGSEVSSQPFYSTVNGFYIGESALDGRLTFKEHQKVLFGVYVSLFSALIIFGILVILILRKYRK